MKLEATILVAGAGAMAIGAVALAVYGDLGSALLAGAWSAWMAMMSQRFRS